MKDEILTFIPDKSIRSNLWQLVTRKRTLSKLRPSQPVKLSPRRSKHEVLILSSIAGMPVNCQPPKMIT